MIQRILNYAIRKDITKKNKSINHKSLIQSMVISQRVPFLAKYHKKKLIAFCLALVIIYTYDLQKPIIRKIVSMRSPLKIVESWFVEQKKIPDTILEQNYAGIDLTQRTINLLTDLYVNADKNLYFGVGRYYLFQVYKDLKLIQTEEQIRKFWVATGFYKQRNQKASGVGLVQHINLFEQGLRHAQKKRPQLSQQQFAKIFTQKFIEKAPQIIRWQSQFNKQRTREFLKNMPGDNEKKKDVIIEIMRDHSQSNKLMLTQQQIETKIVEMGLKGLNLTDKMLYWDLKRIWDTLRLLNIDKKLIHPLTTSIQKIQLNNQKQVLTQQIKKSQAKISQIEQTYEKLYQQKIF